MSPGQVDQSVVARHLAALDGALQQLRPHQGKPAAVLSSDQEERWIVERGLQLCCQNALDLAVHLVARAGRDAGDYTQAVDVLAELGVLPSDFASSFRGIGGFRNALVHGYLSVDPETLHQVLNEKLDEFQRFAQYVRASLKSQ